MTHGSARVPQVPTLAGIGHWHLNAATRCFTWSPEMFHIHGLAPHAGDQPWEVALEALHPGDRARIEGRLQRALLDGAAFEVLARSIRPTGEIRVVRWAGQAERSIDDEIVAVHGVIHDVTEQFEASADGNAALHAFAHAVAHDLKAPMRAIRAMSMHLRNALPEQSLDAAEYCDRIEGAAERMDDLIDGLLGYAEIVAQPALLEVVPLDDLLQGVFAELSPEIRDADAAVVVEPLPSVLGRPPQLHALFHHLVQNAVRYRSPDRPLQVAIQATPAPLPRHTRISVTDNGVGFDPTHATRRLFRPFGRLHDRPSPLTGMGLGLAICKRVVETHGGRIEVDSQPNQGSTFSVTLPVA